MFLMRSGRFYHLSLTGGNVTPTPSFNPGGRRIMDIYAYLKKDHRLVKGLMEKTMASSNASEREELFDEIREELELHSETEEKTFYKAIKEKGPKYLQEKEGHAVEEHDEIRNLLRDLGKISVDSDEWLILFGELKHAVEHHVHEEEG